MGNQLSEIDGQTDEHLHQNGNHQRSGGGMNNYSYSNRSMDNGSSHHHSLPVSAAELHAQHPPLSSRSGSSKMSSLGHTVAANARVGASTFLRKVKAAAGKNSLDSEVQNWEDRWDDDSSFEDDDHRKSGSPTGAVGSNFRSSLDMGHSSHVVTANIGGEKSIQAQESRLSSGALQQQMQQLHKQQQEDDDEDIDELSQKANEVLSSVKWDHYSSRTSKGLKRQQPNNITSAEDAVEDSSNTIVTDDEEQLEDYRPTLNWFLPFLRVLGKGSFGTVVLVRQNNHPQGRLFAMKILRKAHLLQKRQIERTKTERLVLESLAQKDGSHHPFLMSLHFAFQTPTRLFLVLDYCPGGELFFHLSRFKRFPERIAKFYAAELLLALGHLHSLHIIYRDLKPENVLLDSEGHVKLGDFGLAKMNIEHPYRGAVSMCGTPEYMAPEILSQSGHGYCVDYWGLGMIMFEMMTGLPPWYTTDRSKLFKRLQHAPLEIPAYFSQDASTCIRQLLERNPMLRLGVQGVRHCMLHSFFAQIKWHDLYHRRIQPSIRPCDGWQNSLQSLSRNTANDQHSNSSVQRNDRQSQAESAYHLNRAVSNFEPHFTRMPLTTEDSGKAKQRRGSESSDELQQQIDGLFPGFTFDKEDNKTASTSNAAAIKTSKSRHGHAQNQNPHGIKQRNQVAAADSNGRTAQGLR